MDGACYDSFPTRKDAEAFIKDWNQAVAEVYMMEIKAALDKGLRPWDMQFDVAGLFQKEAAVKAESPAVKAEPTDEVDFGRLGLGE